MECHQGEWASLCHLFPVVAFYPPVAVGLINPKQWTNLRFSIWRIILPSRGGLPSSLGSEKLGSIGTQILQPAAFETLQHQKVGRKDLKGKWWVVYTLSWGKPDLWGTAAVSSVIQAYLSFYNNKNTENHLDHPFLLKSSQTTGNNASHLGPTILNICGDCNGLWLHCLT